MSPTSAFPAPMDQHAEPGDRAAARLGRWITSGTGYLAVLTAVGGLLVVLAYAIGGWHITAETVQVTGKDFSWLRPDSWGLSLLQTGNLTVDGLGLAVAVYVAYGIAGRVALVPAFVGGVASASLHTGYLGGLAAAVLAGATTRALCKITVPARWRPLMTKAVIPLLAALTTVVFFSAIISPRLDWLSFWLYQKLVDLELTDERLALGLVLGLIACCDFGGIFKKIAYAYTLAGLSSYVPSPAHMTFMAVVVAAGMAPTLGLSLATVVRRRLFTEAERNYGKVAWLLGLIPVPAAGVPFALRDPLRVIPATMAGGAVTGMLTMTFGSTMAVPYGGVFAADQLGKPLLFAAAIAAGGLVTAGVTVALKSLRRTAPASATADTTATRPKVPVAV
ncbi:fructose-specific PTS transporter subunit EIIC [Streptomyces sp. NBC_00582]|uniref:fructose-specific PTS transporter subunit EIIC n=1 Tax=Streptomyces sp. NBC_00582 TaxID=2975783 RepID=UPI001063FFE6|nr:fructose-specific PTS transporter subunit EIIC [Streptomyces sp. NBC_00582]WUB59313.1 fructose-specific PTS transporter subunit EIIC [Streptomyces sp. NBC_00582]